MKKKLNIPKDFWKDFKDRKDFDEFFGELFQEGINQKLKGEMTDHLGYEKNSKDGDNSDNSRNGDYPKTLKSNLGEITVNVPRDRNAEFDPKAVPTSLFNQILAANWHYLLSKQERLKQRLFALF